mgnify:CR=1 FL=1
MCPCANERSNSDLWPCLIKPCPEHELRKNLLRVEAVSTNKRALDDLCGAQATGYRRVIKHDIPSDRHMGLHDLIGVRNRGVDVAINVCEHNVFRATQDSGSCVLKQALDKLQVVQSIDGRITA